VAGPHTGPLSAAFASQLAVASGWGQSANTWPVGSAAACSPPPDSSPCSSWFPSRSSR